MAFELLGWGLESWAYMVLAAIAGGAFGTAIGALPAFCFTGIMVIAGEAANILKGELGGVLDFAVGEVGVGVTGSLAFGISAASLLFLTLGVEQIPVTHHMTLPSSTAALAAAPLGLMDPSLLLVAALFGAFGALVGEVVQRVFYAHSDTHFDPPAAAIVVATLTIAVLYFAGVFPSAVWIPLP